jgi:iron complex transport system permease protein
MVTAEVVASGRVAPTTRDSRGVVIAARILGLGLAALGVALVALLSLRIGSIGVSTREVWDALFAYNAGSYDQTVIRTLRLPRTIIALGVGAGLAVAGATMQAVTRNPLASPSILGVSSGAAFAIVTAIYFIGITSPLGYIWFAFAGAIAASGLVFLIGAAGRGGASPMKLALAGVVVSASLSAWTRALLLLDEQTLDIARFWFAGSVAGRSLETFWIVSPFLLGGAGATLFMGHQLNVLSMGDDTARALGMRAGRTRLLCSLLVVLITGAAVSAAGPIAFVGLATPHIVRAVVGHDYRWVLPYSLLGGAILLTGADILGRVIARPGEVQVGVVTALAGAPFLIGLARRRNVAN